MGKIFTFKIWKITSKEYEKGIFTHHRQALGNQCALSDDCTTSRAGHACESEPRHSRERFFAVAATWRGTTATWTYRKIIQQYKLCTKSIDQKLFEGVGEGKKVCFRDHKENEQEKKENEYEEEIRW